MVYSVPLCAKIHETLLCTDFEWLGSLLSKKQRNWFLTLLCITALEFSNSTLSLLSLVTKMAL